MSDLEQESGDNSINVQVGELNLQNGGVSVSEARQLAIDVFNSNFYRLSKEAAEIATIRAEKLTDDLLVRLDREKVNLNQATDPDFQYVLFNAQRDFARRSEEVLEQLLIDLLVDRAKTEGHTLKKIILNEALATTPKLTNEHIFLVSLIFSVGYAVFPINDEISDLADVVDETFYQLVSKVDSLNITSYRHLAFVGCGGGSGKTFTFGRKMLDAYPRIFPTDCSEEKAESIVINGSKHGSEVVNIWNEGPVSSTNLTSIGIAIAQANLKRIYGFEFDLSDWV